MADTNPFSNLMSGLANAGTGLATGIGGAVGNFFEPAGVRNIRAQGEEARQVRGEAQAADLGMREAMAALGQAAAQAAQANPQAQPNMLFSTLLQDKGVMANLMKIPAGSHAAALQEMIKGVTAPERKPIVVSEGATLVDQTGQELYANPKPHKPIEESMFSKELAKKMAGNVDKLQEEGFAARHERLLLDELDQMQKQGKVATGGAAAARLWLARIGVKVGNAGDLEVWDAITKKMIPSARAGMPGSVSDFDAKNLLASLPQLINSPQGNAILIDTLKAMNESKIRAGEIANEIAEGDMSMKQATQALRRIPDPMAIFREYQGKRGQRVERAAPERPRLRTWNPETGRIE